MFVERNTGASTCFSLPLHTAYSIFCTAYARSPGTTRMVRGPLMSASPGEMSILGAEKISDEASNPSWVGKAFLAKFDPRATWFNELSLWRVQVL
jgi:hypothetical protein